MKLLAVSHSCVADVNQQLYVALAREGVRVELLVPARWKDTYNSHRASQQLPAVNFPIHTLPVWKPGHTMLHFYRSGIGKIVRSLRPDMVFIDEEPGSLATAQIGAICTASGVPWTCYTKQNILKKYPPPFSLIERFTYRRARCIVALSPEVSDVLTLKGFTGDCPILAHACDLSLFNNVPHPELRAELGLNAPTIGYMGRFVPEKGLKILIESAAILRDEGRRFQILMVGSGSQEKELRELCAHRKLTDFFVWTGAVPHNQAGDYMRCMDIFALPSQTKPHWKEQFGRVIIEAMACGVPVVGSNSGYIPHLIGETGGGLIFRENDAKACSHALKSLLDDEKMRRELGQIGQNAVRERFSYEAIGAQLKTILQNAM